MKNLLKKIKYFFYPEQDYIDIEEVESQSDMLKKHIQELESMTKTIENHMPHLDDAGPIIYYMNYIDSLKKAHSEALKLLKAGEYNEYK